MITVGSIRDWVGLPVLDRDGSKIGSMEAVYYDTSTEEPTFITVKVGLISTSLVFVPLDGAVVSPKDVRVAVDVSYDAARKRVVIRPQSPLSLYVLYTVELSTSLKTAVGGSFPSTWFWQFTTVSIRRPSALFAAVDDPVWVYFVHSYAADASGSDVVATCDYGGPVAAAVERGPLWATQFHPEKSGATGLAVLAGFVAAAAGAAGLAPAGEELR